MDYIGKSEEAGRRFVHGLAGVCVIVALMLAFGSAYAKPYTVHFGVQAWPGVTVKTEVASQLLDTLGYSTQRQQLNTPFILRGLANGDLDVNLGGWYPISASMITPLVKQGKVVRLTANLPHALSGMAVPTYVHKAGVDSVYDLHRYADRFNHKIYGIEPGSTWNTQVKEAIEANRYNLGGWELVQSSTSGMLVQVGRATSNKKWIVFYGWKPHWMNITYDLYYLRGPKHSPIIHTDATVYTLANPSFIKKHPNLAKFFRQFKINSKIQSHWIYAYSYKKRPLNEVAADWISSHLDIVKKWLRGVTTAEGQPGFQAVKAKYGSN